MTTEIAGSSVASRARASWLCPMSAWVSQVILVLSLRGIPGLGLLWLVAALIQFGLIITGLYFGAKVLSLGRSSVAAASWWSAIIGVILSGGTILLIVGLSVAESFR